MLATLVVTGALAQAHATELDREALAFRADLAAAYIAGVQQPDGTFAYEYDFLLGRFLDRDNIVRQTGAGFGLAEYLNYSGKASLREPVERAIGAYEARSIAYGDGVVVSGDATLAGARTGATALALLTELNYFEETRDDRFADLRQAWLRGLQALQRPAGGFAENPGADEESPYFNGETWLALAHYARIFPDEATARDMLARADVYMIERYTRDPDVSFFQWGMMAASGRFETTAEPRFLDYASMQGWLYVFHLSPELLPESNACAAVEGLAAGARALRMGGRASDPGYGPIVERAERELTKSFGMQIMPGQIRIAFAEDRYLFDAGLDRLAGAFLNGRYRPQTRIDATQHCLSAIMRYSALRDAITADK